MMPPQITPEHICSTCGKTHWTTLEVIGGVAAIVGWVLFVALLAIAVICPVAFIAV